MINQAQKIRDTQNIPVIDINYTSIKDEPEKAISDIANQCGVNIQNPNPFGTIKKLGKLKNKQSYLPEDFGINKKYIYQKYSDYIKLYGISLEY